ncbi:MAG: hypothetical protein ACYDGN_06115 [Acidimicrobiales bacterium]
MSMPAGGNRPTRRAPAPRNQNKGRLGSPGAPAAKGHGNTGAGGTRGQRMQGGRPDGGGGETGRYRARRERNFELPRPVVEELRALSGDHTAAVLERQLMHAAQAYERDRYKEALQAVKSVLDAVPQATAARELHGLILYRLGSWRQAAKELRAVHEATDSYDQHPVIADCERAMGRLDNVKQLWEEMRREGVDKEVLVEGRLVMSGALADAGETDEAIKILQPAGKLHRKNADVSLLREWYALANLYELAGDLPRARELFLRVATQAPDLLDAPDRLRAIR